MREENWYKNLMKLAKEDPHYQTCLEEVKRWECAYLALRETLPEMQRRVVEGYLSACEELDHALLMLAFTQTERR